jgi:hypothetical protein
MYRLLVMLRVEQLGGGSEQVLLPLEFILLDLIPDFN